MTSETTHIVEPKGDHTHTIIFLHGRDSNAKDFASELFESEASEPENQPRTLPDLLPTVRWVFPSAPILYSERFRTDMSQWFDQWSLENAFERSELQKPGIKQSTEQIRAVIEEEEKLVPRENIFLAGISQGFVAALMTFLADGRGGFAGLIGMCTWLAPSAVIELRALREPERGGPGSEPVRTTPVLLAHSEDDDVVSFGMAQALPVFLWPPHFQVEWKVYKDGGHWINEPSGVDDIVYFMRRNMGIEENSEPIEGWWTTSGTGTCCVQ